MAGGGGIHSKAKAGLRPCNVCCSWELSLVLKDVLGHLYTHLFTDTGYQLLLPSFQASTLQRGGSRYRGVFQKWVPAPKCLRAGDVAGRAMARMLLLTCAIWSSVGPHVFSHILLGAGWPCQEPHRAATECNSRGKDTAASRRFRTSENDGQTFFFFFLPIPNVVVTGRGKCKFTLGGSNPTSPGRG